MAEVPSVELITKLLNPISKDHPTGEDVAKSDDPVASAAYTDLEMEITKVGEIDYKKTADMAINILQNNSKHVRVAAWLCLSWFRIEELEGLKNGLLVMLQLLQNFGEKLFPEKPVLRSKAVLFLNTDKRFQLITKMSVSDPQILSDIQSTLEEIDKECKKQFTDSAPDLSTLSELIKNCGSTASDSAAAKEEPASDDNTDPAKEPPAEEQKESASPSDIESQPETQEQSEKEIKIAGEVEELLADISADNPVGDNIEESEDQNAMVSYMTLESEIAKYSKNDYPQCITLAKEILQNRCKHLKVAVWLMISWFRTENLDGFRNGLQLLLELLKKYGDQLYPVDQKQKSKAIQILNAEARIKIYEKIKIADSNPDTILEIGKLYSSLCEQAIPLFKDSPPKLNAIEAIINEKTAEAEQFLNRGKEPVSAPEKLQAQGTKTTAASLSSTTTTGPASSASSATESVGVSDEKSAKVAIKKALQFYFQEGSNDSKKRKTPEDISIYGLACLLRWGNINQPQDKDNITQVEGPNEPKQNFITKIYNNKEWDTLIPEIEVNFISNDTFTFWLDAQYYVVKALEQKGGSFNNVADEIKLHLARFLLKNPAIKKFTFKDKKTPFAGPETLQWINDEVMEAFSAGKSKEKILPPIMGEDYKPINKMYEEACEKLPDDFSKNAKAMQQAIDGENRKKGRFIRLLNLANYCYLAKKYLLAQPLFNQLMEQIEEYNISEWEAALCVSVWQSTYINNQKLIDGEKDGPNKTALEKMQKELFDKIVKYDAVLALNLESHIQNEGE